MENNKTSRNRPEKAGSCCARTRVCPRTWKPCQGDAQLGGVPASFLNLRLAICSFISRRDRDCFSQANVTSKWRDSNLLRGLISRLFQNEPQKLFVWAKSVSTMWRPPLPSLSKSTAGEGGRGYGRGREAGPTQRGPGASLLASWVHSGHLWGDRGYGLSPYIHADRLESREHLYVITATAIN